MVRSTRPGRSSSPPPSVSSKHVQKESPLFVPPTSVSSGHVPKKTHFVVPPTSVSSKRVQKQTPRGVCLTEKEPTVAPFCVCPLSWRLAVETRMLKARHDKHVVVVIFLISSASPRVPWHPYCARVRRSTRNQIRHHSLIVGAGLCRPARSSLCRRCRWRPWPRTCTYLSTGYSRVWLGYRVPWPRTFFVLGWIVQSTPKTER